MTAFDATMVLLAFAANPMHKDLQGQTASDYAKKAKNYHIALVLKYLEANQFSQVIETLYEYKYLAVRSIYTQNLRQYLFKKLLTEARKCLSCTDLLLEAKQALWQKLSILSDSSDEVTQEDALILIYTLFNDEKDPAFDAFLAECRLDQAAIMNSLSAFDKVAANRACELKHDLQEILIRKIGSYIRESSFGKNNDVDLSPEIAIANKLLKDIKENKITKQELCSLLEVFKIDIPITGARGIKKPSNCFQTLLDELKFQIVPIKPLKSQIKFYKTNDSKKMITVVPSEAEAECTVVLHSCIDQHMPVGFKIG